MKTKSEKVLILMQVFAWIAMVGYAIEAGAKIISTIISFYNPKAAFNIYKGLFMTTLIFIITHVFKIGVKIQEENDLTV